MPAAIRGHLERAHRAVPEDGMRVAQLLGEERRGPRSDVQPEPVGGDRVGRDDLVVGVRGERGGGDDVDGQDDLDALGLGLVEVPAHGVELVLLEQALADLVALGLEEGEHHPAADEQPVGGAEQVADDPELVGHLRATEHDRIRPVGVLGEPLEHVDLGRDQAAGGVRQEAGDVVDRRLLPVHDAEAVGDEDVGERGERLGELGPLLVGLGRLARVEPEVLQEDDVTRAGRRDGGRGRLPHRVGGEGDVTAEQLTEPLRDRRQRVLVLRGALGPAEVGADHDGRARLGEGLDRRDGRLDAPVVGDRLPVQRDVEVGPDEYPLAAQVAVRQEVGESAHRPTGPCRRARRRR